MPHELLQLVQHREPRYRRFRQDEALVTAEIREWGSYHPDGDDRKQRPRTGGAPSTSYFFCLKTKPAVSWQGNAGAWQGAVLDIASPSGAEENATIQYFAVYHGVRTGGEAEAPYDALAKRFGYAPVEGADLQPLARPEDILKD